jgi:polysaccharide pyruvyl transferase WcaK-like protein
MFEEKIVIEVRKAGFINKGAQLMLLSVLDQIRIRNPHLIIAVAPGRDSPYLKRAKLGLYQKPTYFRYGIQFAKIFIFIPLFVRKMLGIVLDHEVDIVLDAAGLAYTDKWGTHHISELAYYSKIWKKNGTKVVLLPQAFGPFENGKNKKNMCFIMNNIDLVFARDRISHNYLSSISDTHNSLSLSPDFTNLLIPNNFHEQNAYKEKICIIPNARMIDMTEDTVSQGYVKFMKSIVGKLLERGESVFFLNHEGYADELIAKEICNGFSEVIPLISPDDPLEIKAIIGSSKAVVGSRFHGLVSALSQDVPSLALGWSHKYEMLFEDYECENLILHVGSSQHEIELGLDNILKPVLRNKLISKLNFRSSILKRQSQEMWDRVFSFLDATCMKSD